MALDLHGDHLRPRHVCRCRIRAVPRARSSVARSRYCRVRTEFAPRLCLSARLVSSVTTIQADPGVMPGEPALLWRVTRDWDAPSLFRPENMLREARRQKGLPPTPVPTICVLDPDGDIVAHAIATRRGERAAGWACFHSDLVTFDPAEAGSGAGNQAAGRRLGVIGRVVVAPYAVMVAEQLFASGCRFLISVASAGQIADIAE